MKQLKTASAGKWKNRLSATLPLSQTFHKFEKNHTTCERFRQRKEIHIIFQQDYYFI